MCTKGTHKMYTSGNEVSIPQAKNIVCISHFLFCLPICARGFSYFLPAHFNNVAVFVHQQLRQSIITGTLYLCKTLHTPGNVSLRQL